MYGNGDWMEPDIDGCNANGDAVEYDYKTDSYVLARNDDDPSHQEIIPPYYKYEFRTEEELITSSVFQRCLGQAIAHKDIEIHRLREELLKEYWRRQ